MLAFVFAMVVLQNAAPDPSTTAGSAIAQKLAGTSSATGLQNLDTTSPLGNIKITATCTYGTPLMAPALGSDIGDLARTYDAPASNVSTCADATPFGISPLGFVPMFGTMRPASAALGFTPLVLGASARELSAASTFTLPARSGARVLDHLVLPAEFRAGAGPMTISTGEPARATALRRPQTKAH